MYVFVWSKNIEREQVSWHPKRTSTQLTMAFSLRLQLHFYGRFADNLTLKLSSFCWIGFLLKSSAMVIDVCHYSRRYSSSSHIFMQIAFCSLSNSSNVLGDWLTKSTCTQWPRFFHIYFNFEFILFVGRYCSIIFSECFEMSQLFPKWNEENKKKIIRLPLVFSSVCHFVSALCWYTHTPIQWQT